MRIKASKKHILICLLLCSLFLTSYMSAFITNGISSDLHVFAGSSLSGANEQSSMNGGTDFGHFGYMTNADTSSFLFSAKQSRGLVTKTGFNNVTAIIAALIICLIYSSSLLGKTCTPLNAIQIIIFLHKKDGMK